MGGRDDRVPQEEERENFKMNKNIKQRLISVVTMVVAALVASSVVGMIASAKPAHAAFAGSAGDIAFSSDRSGDFNIYRMGADGFGPTKLTSDINSSSWYREPAWSSDGTKIAYSYHLTGAFGNSHDGIGAKKADGSYWAIVAESPDGTTVYSDPAFYPGGKNKIVYEDSSTGGGDLYSNFESPPLYYYPENLTRLTKSKFEETAPSVSPDGKKLAFASDRDGDMDIYVMKATSPEGPTNKPVKLTRNSVYDNFPDWSPSGKKIAFQGYRSGGLQEILVMNADGTHQVNLTKNSVAANDAVPSFSPDGKKIAFASDRDGGDYDIWRMRADGSNPVNLTSDSTGFDWDPAWQPLP